MTTTSPPVAIPPPVSSITSQSPRLSHSPVLSPVNSYKTSQHHRSFAERKAEMLRPTSTPPKIIEGSDAMTDIDRPPPGDVWHGRKNSKRGRVQSRPDLAKQRSQYFEEVFAVNKSQTGNPAKDRVLNESVVTAELTTNVRIEDNAALLTSLASHLSTRYSRPLTSIIISLQHSATVLFSGALDQPSYTLTIVALPSQLQPATNRRNAALIQSHLAETLGVRPSRGFVRFVPAAEDNVATRGKTLAGELEEAARPEKIREQERAEEKEKDRTLTPAQAAEEFVGIKKVVGIDGKEKKSRLGMRSFPGLRSSTPAPAPAPVASQVTPTVAADTGVEGSNDQDKTTRRKKSFVASFFGRT